MTACVTDLLYEYALEALDEPARRAVQDHIDRCEACARELREVSDGLALLALELPPAPSPPQARERLLAAAADSGRFDEFAPEVARIFDVSIERARELVRYLDQAPRWMQGPSPGIKLIPVQPGPQYQGHTSSFVRLEPGETFPWHEHLGDETLVVLQGVCVEPDGTTFRRSQHHCHVAGTAHAFSVPPKGPPFIAAVRVAVGIRFVAPPE